jgi:hypothetical protein
LIEFLLFIIAYRLWFPKTETYSCKQNNEEIERTEQIILRTLKNYPDSDIGFLYPELKYQALSELYSERKISKEFFHNEIDKIFIFDKTGKG